MKIAVYSKDKVSTFRLPVQIVGSYSFDVSSNEQKVINVTGENGTWVLHQTSDTKIVSGNQFVDRVAITDNTFYTLRKKDVNYLVYAYSYNSINVYTYDKSMSLVIGNGNGANIDYNCAFLKAPITISFENDMLMLKKDQTTLVYVNNKILIPTSTELRIGDEIDIFGLKITFLSASLLSINALSNVTVDALGTAHITSFTVQAPVDGDNFEIEDRELYTPDDYYSKSPRLRRNADPKVFPLNPPPNVEKETEQTPALLVIGPMITMGMTSFVTTATSLYSTFTKGSNASSSLPQLLISFAMICSMFVWPNVMKMYNKKVMKKAKQKAIKKYTKYLNKFEENIVIAQNSQRVIVNENLLSLDECIKSIETRGMNFWDKRMDQNDFLYTRVGVGEDYQTCRVEYEGPEYLDDEEEPAEGDKKEKKKKKKEDKETKQLIELGKKAAEIAEKYSSMDNMPIGYSFLNNPITAIMGPEKKQIGFINNTLLQLLTYYSYDDVKIVILSSEENESNWEYIKYLNHNFNNPKTIRLFGTTNQSINHILDFLNFELNNRMSQSQGKSMLVKPYYIIVCDQYDRIKRSNFIKTLTELDANLGFSLIIAENKLNKLPSKCNSFITLGNKTSDILINDFESQQHITFQDEVRTDIDMNKLTKILSNIPIEFSSSDSSQLPESVTFLEMEKVGRVEQLNILNRWKNNDAINTLKAEVGLDENGDELYLDIHEKAHGPHGLIAGTTGSGKSEFIITYILSLAINYSPEEVAFILIDYKGGGLAYAFENKQNNICLPHLSGTITNLDKAEMDRTLVSINSEVKRRQKVFNEARDQLGESTMDIYKYQGLYRDGKLTEPVPHLLIICDEFAELKSQQPDFMDNLISVARIGRSLGVHLILATQKPSGVVNEQIWSNSKFKVCLKVQDEADSKEMLKKPDAAAIKEAGRFYLQVGFDEYYALGQSGWSGAKYYPQDEIIKNVDKSINFIGPSGNRIKSMQLGTKRKGQAQGEQLAAVMNSVIDLANQVNLHANKLWLDNIPEIVLDDALVEKYGLTITPYLVEGIVGEFDAPEAQEQGLVKYSYVNDGNGAIYGVDGTEREMLLNSLIYSTTKYHTADEVQIYIADFGSESLKRYERLPQIGGVVVAGEDEKFVNLLKMIREEIKTRKQLFTNFGGEFTAYNKASEKKKPVDIIIFNNYDSLGETYPFLFDDLPELLRDSERYGIVFIFTGNSAGSIPSKIRQNFRVKYALRVNDPSDYSMIFDMSVKINIRSFTGRGILKHDVIHEFQTASVVEDQNQLNDFINQYIDAQLQNQNQKANKIPVLPEIVTYEDIAVENMKYTNIPLGLDKHTLDVVTYDFAANTGTIIASNKLQNTNNVVRGILSVFKRMPGSINIIFDPSGQLHLDKKVYTNCYDSNNDKIIEKVTEYINKLRERNEKTPGIIFIHGLTKFQDIVTKEKFDKLVEAVKKYEKLYIIASDATAKVSKIAYEPWYQTVFSNSDGIWIGKGVANQSSIRIGTVTKEMNAEIKNNLGYVITENSGVLCKYIEIKDTDNGGNNDEK